MSNQKTNVMEYLEAFASGIGNQPIENTDSFFNIAINQLKTEDEREAFRLGALAISADAAGYKIRAAYYRRKFKKAMKVLQK